MLRKIKEQKSEFLVSLQNPKRFALLPDGWIKDGILGLDWGPSSEKRMEMKDAVKYCAGKGGRLPEVHELHSLVDFTKRQPACNEIFKDMKHDDCYWTKTPLVGVSFKASWVVGFCLGYVYFNFENNVNYVRPVRVSQ